ncbi:MAG: tetratricopeptide repeat protein [bacterium]
MPKNVKLTYIFGFFFIVTVLTIFFLKIAGKEEKNTWVINAFRNDNDNVSENILKEIKTSLQPPPGIILKKTSVEINDNRQALKKLKKSNAELMIWGKIEDGNIRFYLTMQRPACNYIAIDNSIASLLNLKNIEFTDTVKNFNENNGSLIKIFLRGYVQYLNRDYKTAISVWGGKFPDNPIISFFLGNACLLHSQTGEQVRYNHLEARKYYQNIIPLIDKNENLIFYQSILNNLGVHYLSYPFDLNSENFVNAQNYLKQAVKTSPDWSNEEYGIALSNLAIVYENLYFGDKNKFDRLVIKNFSESIRVFREHKNKEMQAVTYNNLGVSYFKIKNEMKENVKEVLNNLNRAEQLVSKDNQAEVFYLIIANLGLTYIYKNDIKEALKHFTMSLEFFKGDIYPIQFGFIQENLGNILLNMRSVSDESNLIEAVKYYENALKVINQDNRPVSFGRISSNLGLIYSSLKYNKGPDNLKKAEYFYNNALKVFEKDLYPIQYAGLKNNLANIFVELSMLNETGSLKDVANLLESAIKYFNEAFEIYKKFGGKRELIMTKVNLANAYTHLPLEKKTNINKAISIYEDILLSADNKEYYDIVQHNMEAAKKILQDMENKTK